MQCSGSLAALFLTAPTLESHLVSYSDTTPCVWLLPESYCCRGRIFAGLAKKVGHSLTWDNAAPCHQHD